MADAIDSVHDLCLFLKVPLSVSYTSYHFLHRWHLVENIEWNLQNICSVVFLSCKVNESPRKIRDVIVGKMYIDGCNVEEMVFDENYVSIKEEIVRLEHRLLRILGFDLVVEFPHKYLLNFARLLKLSKEETQMAVVVANNCMKSEHIIKSTPHVFALVAIFLGVNRNMGKRLSQNYQEVHIHGIGIRDITTVIRTSMDSVMSHVNWMENIGFSTDD